MAASAALLMLCVVVVGGCAKPAVDGWAQNSPIIQPIPPMVNLGAKAE